MKKDSSDYYQSFETKLIFILSNVNDWLKFAEAKNAGLLVFSAGCIVGLLSYTASSPNLSTAWKTGIFSSIFFLILASLFCILSFLPKINRIEVLLWQQEVSCSDDDNFLYYGDLSKYTCEELLDAITRKYYQDERYLASSVKFHLDIADQIIINSKIALRKYNLFSLALYSTVISVFSSFILSAITALFS